MRTDLTCTERYLGAKSDVAHIHETLWELRRQPLTRDYVRQHLGRVKQVANIPAIESWLLSDFMAHRPITHFDYDAFERAVDVAVECVRRRHPRFRALPTDSYVVAEAEGGGNPGGFFGRLGIGFQYESHFAFSELLDPTVVPDSRVRALEFARNYIHDSFHAATCRTFARFRSSTFRYQYGFNFRLPTGISYSGAQASHELGFVANLNTLMDGMAAMTAAEAMAASVAEVAADGDWVAEILNELVGDYARVGDPDMLRFAEDVVFPTRAFIDYWGGDALRQIIGDAMLSGELTALKRAIADRSSERIDDDALSQYLQARRREYPFLGRDIWQDLFLSVDFYRGIGADPALRSLGRYSGVLN